MAARSSSPTLRRPRRLSGAAPPSPVQAALAQKDLLPSRHLVDAGYLDADQLVAGARGHGVALIGPTPRDNQWQERTSGAFMLEDFALDWDRRVATCPEGRTSRSWNDERDLGRTVIRIRFSTTHCKACPSKPRCTRATRRPLTPRPREKHETLVAARARETEPEFIADRRSPLARRGRGHPLARGARHGPASRPLHWAGPDALAASRYRAAINRRRASPPGCRTPPQPTPGDPRSPA